MNDILTRTNIEHQMQLKNVNMTGMKIETLNDR